MGTMMQMDASDRARGFYSVWSEEWLEADERVVKVPECRGCGCFKGERHESWCEEFVAVPAGWESV
jgi:hypothetical protein